MDLLAEHTTTTFAEQLDDVEVALLPTGSVEQHGPALPLGTDYMAAREVTHTLDREDTVALPTVPVGVSSHHRQFDGTLWITPETFEDYVYDVVASIASHGVRKVVLVNGHGGNSDALSRAARRLREDDLAFAAPWNWWSNLGDLAEDLYGEAGIGHADAMETSMMYAVREELVRRDSLEDAEAGGAAEWGREIHGASVAFDAAEFTESGAVGNPTDGSPEDGLRLFDHAVADLDALVAWLAEQDFADLRPPEHR